MATQDKDVNRGGSFGQEGELSPEGGNRGAPLGNPSAANIDDGGRPTAQDMPGPGGRLDERGEGKQRGGREPAREEKRRIQPTHAVD